MIESRGIIGLMKHLTSGWTVNYWEPRRNKRKQPTVRIFMLRGDSYKYWSI